MKKVFAMVLFLVLVVTTLPIVSAAPLVSSVRVYNYTRSGGNLHDPANINNYNFIVSAPYDSIAWSSLNSATRAPNYSVIFTLNSALTYSHEITLNGNRLSMGYNTVGGKLVQVDPYTVTCYFTCQRGGNTQPFTLSITDYGDQAIARHTATVTYYDSEASVVPANTTMYVSASRTSNDYTVWSNGQNIYIDYNSLYNPIGSSIDVNFTFTDAAGNRIPYSGSAKLAGATSNGRYPFISSSWYDLTLRGIFTYQLAVPVTVDPSIKQASFTVDANGRRYSSSSYNIIWRDMRSSASGTGSYNDSLTISPSHAPTLAVGQEYAFRISSNDVINTGAYFTLDISGTSGIVSTATGKYLTIRGVAPGSTILNVRNSVGTVITTIPVTVVGYGTPITASSAATYQVTASSVDVRSGSNVNYSYLGTLKYGAKVTVYGFDNGYAQIGYNNDTGYVYAGSLSYVGGYINGGGSVTPYSTGSLGSESQAYAGTLNPNYSSEILGGAMTGEKYYDLRGGRYMTVTGLTNIFAGSGTGYTYLGAATQGQRVFVRNVSNSGWAMIDWNSGVGYIDFAKLW